MAKASSFRLRVLMPIALAAISSSRIAIQARPMRESSSRMQTNDHQRREQQEQVVVQCVPGNSRPSSVLVLANDTPSIAIGSMHVHALRAVGDVDRRVQIVQEDADDLAEAERDDGEVVAAQPQRRRAQQHAEERRDQRRPAAASIQQRQMHAEVRRGEQRIDVGADRVERDVAEVEQAGVADDDVEPEREHDVEQREVDDAHPACADRRSSANGSSSQRDHAPAPMPDPFAARIAAATRRSAARAEQPSCALRHALAEQPGGPEHQHQDQDQEGEDVLVVAAENAAGEVADVAGAEALDQSRAARRRPSPRRGCRCRRAPPR